MIFIRLTKQTVTTYAGNFSYKILNWHYSCAFLDPAIASGSGGILPGAGFEKKRRILAGARPGCDPKIKQIITSRVSLQVPSMLH